jgi:hypothetical protein
LPSELNRASWNCGGRCVGETGGRKSFVHIIDAMAGE